MSDKFYPPEGAVAAAKKALKWKKEYGNEVKAMTKVGWTRASQLASGKGVSLDVVKRMAAFERHRKNSKISSENKDSPWKDNGYVAWLGWGGDAGIDWAKEQVSKNLNESAPPDPKIEKWIKDNKERFIDKYGEEKGTSILYATAWKMYDRLDEAFVRDIPVLNSIASFIRKRLTRTEAYRIGVDMYKDAIEDFPRKTKEHLAAQVAMQLAIPPREFIDFLRTQSSLVGKYRVESIKYPRHSMPQIPSDKMKDFLSELSSKGIQSKTVTISAKNIKPTQNINKEKVESLKVNDKRNVPIVVSSDFKIVDGHHRWAAKLANGEKIVAVVIPASHSQILSLAREFKDTFYAVEEKEKNKKEKIILDPNLEEIEEKE